MEPGMLSELTGVVAVFFGGAIILAPVLALSARFALKPVMESFAKLRHGSAADLTQDRRIALLEAELQNVQTTLQHLVEADDFKRQLAVPAAHPTSLPPRPE